MALQESGEMYLETILTISKQKGNVRSIDISEHMQYSKPSVSRAVGLLKQQGFINVANDGHITLTETGRQKAEMIYERHQILTAALIALGVDSKTAAADACKIEHDISQTSFNAIKQYLNNIKK